MATGESSPNEPAQDAAPRDVRLDQPHPVRRAGAPHGRPKAAQYASAADAAELDALQADDASVAEAVAGRPSPAELEDGPALAASPLMLAQHAANLADRLQQRLADVDRRESRLNSQEAEFDSRVRNARLWIDQRDTEIAEQERRLQAWEEDLKSRHEAAAARFEEAAELQQRLKELAHRENAAEAKTAQVDLAHTELQTKLDALEFEMAACRTRQQELEQARQRCEQRQRELDHREAQIYTAHEQATRERMSIDAQAAQLRDWETTIVSRDANLAATQERLTENASALEFERAEFRQKVVEHEDRAHALANDQRRLEFRRREIETAIKRFERLGIVEEKMAEVQQQADAMAMRAQYLDHAEAMLAERELQLSEQLRELEHQRLAFQNQSNKERRGLAAETDAARSSADARRREVDRRDASLDQREQALEEVAEQLRSAQREALEMRLATEETWLELQGALAPASLSRSIAQVRSRLMDHFQLAADEARNRRKELEAVRQELADRFRELEGQRAELQRWAKTREEDIEARAARLIEREAELDAQHRHFEAREKQWLTERSEYQHEIQRLLAELRGPLKMAA